MAKKDSVQYYGTGRRKSSVARVYVTSGTGKIVVNGRDINEYMPYAVLVMDVKQPLTLTGTEGKYDVRAEVKGGGFTDSPFKFANGTSISLLNMNVSGTLNLQSGSWTNLSTGNISPAKTTSENTANGTYLAQMLPDYVFTDNDNTNVMQFTIDENVYYITQDMLFDALVYDANNNGTKDAGDGDLVVWSAQIAALAFYGCDSPALVRTKHIVAQSDVDIAFGPVTHHIGQELSLQCHIGSGGIAKTTACALHSHEVNSQFESIATTLRLYLIGTRLKGIASHGPVVLPKK